MISTLLSGFITGMVLQLAIGPVFFFILNLALQKTLIDGWSAVVAVTMVDYLYIVLAVAGVGKLMEKPRIKQGLGIAGPVVLLVFGLVTIVSAGQGGPTDGPGLPVEPNCAASFIAAFLLTVSSPLTIVFWTGLFAARAVEKGYTRKQLLFFGSGAGLATLIFLGVAVTLLSILRASVPAALLTVSNTAVGLLLIVYGAVRLIRTGIVSAPTT